MSDPAQESGDEPHFPRRLRLAEAELVDVRRKVNGCDEAARADGHVGVGLSGGGIRSATFCLGVFQALSNNDGELLKRIDYLSTVSGGGYFGSFFGRLFAREEITTVKDVAAILQGGLLAKANHSSTGFLRDNGRYLAPRGSGDLLALIAVTLRNWAAVQLVLAAFVLAAFVALQSADIVVRGAAVAQPAGHFVWSPVFWLLIPVALLAVVPTAWAYWVIGQPWSKATVIRRSDVIVLAVLAGGWGVSRSIAQIASYFPALAQYVESSVVLGSSSFRYAAGALAVAAASTTVWSWLVSWRGISGWFRALLTRKADDESDPVSNANSARNLLTRWLKRALVALAIIAVVGLVDTLGATIYAVFQTEEGFGNVTAAAATLGAALGGFAAFGRQLLVLLRGESRNGRPMVSLSIAAWLAALVIVGCWLVALNAASHAVAWAGDKPPHAEQLFASPPPKLAEASMIAITSDVGRQLIEAVDEGASAAIPVADKRDAWFTAGALAVLAALVVMLGKNRAFLNNSSLHTFYSQRLTRAYLGASNVKRLTDKAHLADVVPGDDLPAGEYWTWPTLRPQKGWVGMARDGLEKAYRATLHVLHLRRKSENAEEPSNASDTSRDSAAQSIANKGGPLHIVNVTINETLDRRTGVQSQDRKGVPMAVGPCGFSVGVRHHLVSAGPPDKGDQGSFTAYPKENGYVFKSGPAAFDKSPETLTLGRWASISGAAFSSAIGARTTVPLALLCTFANVRLGYWWDSGLGKDVTRPFLPVYSGLLAESIARLHGTGDQFWNLSDGGHFENLAGYELIRRKLPLIVLIDAEADPDFEFPGLSELIRKARLDFGADIEFLQEPDIPPTFGGSTVFTSLEGLRRAARASGGKDDAEDGEPPSLYKALNLKKPVEAPAPRRAVRKIDTTFSTVPDRSRYSLGHAALAKVTYKDASTGWLVYVKAAIDGDEPTDVLQYHAKHVDFPHEPTTDQFFDEAQWESYRRLGEHVGELVLTKAVFDLASTPR